MDAILHDLTQGIRALVRLLGIVLGLAIAVASARFMGGFLFGVAPHDPLALLAAAILVAAVALAACAMPVRRAVRVDPMVVLRRE